MSIDEPNLSHKDRCVESLIPIVVNGRFTYIENFINSNGPKFFLLLSAANT